ncbi:MAG: diaminopimelate epimerase [Crocinitomicaceae bacterium]|nr:diaminopimelate epimerase [Crocinitomicaceae bacterium]MDG1657916.1 diaminopimelate epimerase [Crocinitomicaceae bacterium]
MNISFVKYQGTGNDFVMIDNRSSQYSDLSEEVVKFICDRKHGVGADGLILISPSENADFYVDYYNADGSQSFCGNGARCSVAFAEELGLIDASTTFDAIDGIHRASIREGIVRLEMLDVARIESNEGDYFVETGSPHYVHLKEEGADDIVSYGRSIRYSKSFEKEGVNVNYLDSLSSIEISVETYERGVEDETLSCGTGVTACALVQMTLFEEVQKVRVRTKGGDLSVEACSDMNGGFTDIWLSGPAKKVFNGSVDV